MKLKTIIATLALVAIPALSFAQTQVQAQEIVEVSNEQLSSDYKLKIEVLKHEIKTLKAKQKAEPSNPAHVTEMISKKSELKDLQAKNKIVDKAIKTEKAMKRANEKAEKAKAKAEKAMKEAESMRKKKL